MRQKLTLHLIFVNSISKSNISNKWQKSKTLYNIQQPQRHSSLIQETDTIGWLFDLSCCSSEVSTYQLFEYCSSLIETFTSFSLPDKTKNEVCTTLARFCFPYFRFNTMKYDSIIPNISFDEIMNCIDQLQLPTHCPPHVKVSDVFGSNEDHESCNTEQSDAEERSGTWNKQQTKASIDSNNAEIQQPQQVNDQVADDADSNNVNQMQQEQHDSADDAANQADDGSIELTDSTDSPANSSMQPTTAAADELQQLNQHLTTNTTNRTNDDEEIDLTHSTNSPALNASAAPANVAPEFDMTADDSDEELAETESNSNYESKGTTNTEMPMMEDESIVYEGKKEIQKPQSVAVPDSKSPNSSTASPRSPHSSISPVATCTLSPVSSPVSSPSSSSSSARKRIRLSNPFSPKPLVSQPTASVSNSSSQSALLSPVSRSSNIVSPANITPSTSTSPITPSRTLSSSSNCSNIVHPSIQTSPVVQFFSSSSSFEIEMKKDSTALNPFLSHIPSLPFVPDRWACVDEDRCKRMNQMSAMRCQCGRIRPYEYTLLEANINGDNTIEKNQRKQKRNRSTGDQKERT